jgi:serpin B
VIVMKKKIIGLVLLACFAMVTSCSKDDDAPGTPKDETEMGGNGSEPNDTSRKSEEPVVYMLPETRSITLTSEQRQLVAKSNAFSYNLYKTVCSTEQQKGKSVVMSPLSALYVLGMLNDGAAGDTEKQISSLLGLTAGNKEAVNGYCQALMTQAPLADPSVTLETANIVATVNDLALAQPFKSDMQQYYLAETASLDFSQPSALQFLNNWCNQKTQGMIPSILDQLDAATRLVLMNAVFFKATWTEKFDEADTRQEAFTDENGQAVTTPVMHRKALALYAPGDTYSTLCLPYGSGSKWQMMVMLPNEGKTVYDIIDSLTAVPWETQWLKNRDAYEVDIKMPRFTTASDVVLNSIIAQMGAPLMFTEYADFTAMTATGEPLYVSLMKQKAAIEVTEEGTKASAVTVAVMDSAEVGPADVRQVDFHAIRPFVYLIQETSSGAVFFIGTYRGN